MGQFVNGDVVVLSFPFSDLSQSKRRPALVVAALQGDDLILCQITSQARDDAYSVRLDTSDFVVGGLNQSSRIRPNRLFTADSNIVIYKAGQVSRSKLQETRERLIAILS
ncbi:MAG: type II toxin-antitoxin system PemK/MazF family toxin [Acidobacteria bacterium]|nr:type II toxin-antitoxin system PemK/MazF family toxin [Acidobacteriota bacterium]